MNKYGNVSAEKYTNTFVRIESSVSQLSDYEILTLQELFLTPGMHAIRITTSELVANFLQALKYRKIGYVGSAQYGHNSYQNLSHAIEEIMEHEELLADYFVEEFDSEILIINEEDTIVVDKTYGAIVQYGIDKTIPIICQIASPA